MNINTTSNQENNTNETKMEWQAPVLYKEDWLSITLTGVVEGLETPTSTSAGGS